jgi:hypothetical protein
MKDPDSCHSRNEFIHCWLARKIADTPEPGPYRYLPGWLVDYQNPIPQTPHIQATAMQHSLFAALLGMVDGQRTLANIALAFSAHHRLPYESALASVVGFFTKVYEEGQIGAGE